MIMELILIKTTVLNFPQNVFQSKYLSMEKHSLKHTPQRQLIFEF